MLDIGFSTTHAIANMPLGYHMTNLNHANTFIDPSSERFKFKQLLINNIPHLMVSQWIIEYVFDL